MKYRILFFTLAAAMSACVDYPAEKRLDRTPVPYRTLAVEGHASVNFGGYGSSICFHAADSSFYLLTDRGPNVAGLEPESLLFPLPDYAPTIGQFRLRGDSLALVRTIPLRQQDGTPFNGLPVAGDGATGETGYDLRGDRIDNPGRGIDPEGLAVAADGTFWVSDEYGPYILHFDRDGVLVEQLAPGAGLPEHYALRRPNRGMEGLTLSADGAKLYGIMQSPLYYPDATTKNRALNNRIVEIDLRDAAVREYLYRMDDPANMLSEICYAGPGELLVLERDGMFPVDGQGFKKVFRVTIGDSARIAGEPIEPLGLSELAGRGVRPVEKRLLVDLLQAVPGYRHDKPEGIALMGDSVLCVVNDDDFGIAPGEGGGYTLKLDPQGVRDVNVIYYLSL